MKYAKAHSLRAQQAVAGYGKAARHPLCLAALDLWRLDAELSAAIKKVGQVEELVNSTKQPRERAEADQDSALLRKIDKLSVKVQTCYEAAVGVPSFYQELRLWAAARFERERDAVARTGGVQARLALRRVRKRWNKKKAFLGDSDRRAFEMLKMLRDKVTDEATARGGMTGRYLEAGRGGDRALSDEAWQGLLTAREIQSRLIEGSARHGVAHAMGARGTLTQLLGVVDHLRRRFARFKSATGRTRCGELCAHLLQARSKRINLLLLRVNLATCF